MGPKGTGESYDSSRFLAMHFLPHNTPVRNCSSTVDQAVFQVS